MTDPIFFFVRRTARTTQLHAATAFHADGTFTRMLSNHPDARSAIVVMGALTACARKLQHERISADKLLEAARGYLNADTYERLRLIQPNQRAGLPARICLRAMP